MHVMRSLSYVTAVYICVIDTFSIAELHLHTCFHSMSIVTFSNYQYLLSRFCLVSFKQHLVFE